MNVQIMGDINDLSLLQDIKKSQQIDCRLFTLLKEIIIRSI